VAGLKFERRIFITKVGHHRLLFDTCRQLWYGDFVQDPWATVVMIRQNLEIRLRHCLDIVGVVVDGVQMPLPVTSVLAALKEESSARSIVPWSVLLKIYAWSNIYVHTGAKDYPWLGGYAMFLLRPLMTGVQERDGGWSVDNAIRVTSAGVERVFKNIIAQLKRGGSKKDVKILSLGLQPRATIEK